MKNPLIEYVSFHPVKKLGSLIGFCGFHYDKNMRFSELAVHKLLKPKDNIKIRILYPDKVTPLSKQVQQEIDNEINAYIISQYPQVLNDNKM